MLNVILFAICCIKCQFTSASRSTSSSRESATSSTTIAAKSSFAHFKYSLCMNYEKESGNGFQRLKFFVKFSPAQYVKSKRFANGSFFFVNWGLDWLNRTAFILITQSKKMGSCKYSCFPKEIYLIPIIRSRRKKRNPFQNAKQLFEFMSM